MASDVLSKLSAEELELAPPAPAPQTAGAMKAVLTDDHFSDPNWIYERKLNDTGASRSGMGCGCTCCCSATI